MALLDSERFVVLETANAARATLLSATFSKVLDPPGGTYVPLWAGATGKSVAAYVDRLTMAMIVVATC